MTQISYLAFFIIIIRHRIHSFIIIALNSLDC